MFTRYLVLLGALAVSACSDPPAPIMCMAGNEWGIIVTVTPGTHQTPIYGYHGAVEGHSTDPDTTIKVRMANGPAQGTMRICKMDSAASTPFVPGDKASLTLIPRLM